METNKQVCSLKQEKVVFSSVGKLKEKLPWCIWHKGVDSLD